MRDIKYIILHCSDSRFGDTNLIRQWHMERGWVDIGYNFVILNGQISNKEYFKSVDGSIEIGRSIKINGAHTRGYNEDSIGICLIGANKFTNKQIDAAIKLINELRELFKIPLKNILGHYETKLAGGKTCPNIDMSEFREEINEWDRPFV